MAYYLEEDGKTVVRYHGVPDGIELPDGRVVPDGKYNDGIFAVHPDENTRMRKDKDGVYEYLHDTKMERVGKAKPTKYKPGATAPFEYVGGTWVSTKG